MRVVRLRQWESIGGTDSRGTAAQLVEGQIISDVEMQRVVAYGPPKRRRAAVTLCNGRAATVRRVGRTKSGDVFWIEEICSEADRAEHERLERLRLEWLDAQRFHTVALVRDHVRQETRRFTAELAVAFEIFGRPDSRYQFDETLRRQVLECLQRLIRASSSGQITLRPVATDADRQAAQTFVTRLIDL